MTDQYLQGIVVPPGYQSQIRDEISVIAINWFPNRTPFITRFPKEPVTSPIFHIVTRKYRPRTVTLGASFGSTDTTITLVDASYLMTGDVLETLSGEYIELTAMPSVSANTIAVNRHVAGTSAAASSGSSDVLTLIGNSRTGGEINQQAVSFTPLVIDQYCQNFQHVVQIGGSTQSTPAMQLAPGFSTPLDQNKMESLQNLMDDFEYSSFYGLGETAANAVSGRQKQRGIRQILTLQYPTNITTSPTNAGAYKPSDLTRDTIQLARQGGGAPDVLVVSQDFITGFTVWGMPLVRLVEDRTVLGVDVTSFKAPFLNDITIIEHPLLKTGTAICLTSAEARTRLKRPWMWNPYGSRGDAFEGDFTAEGATELENAGHHAWVEGITAFSAN